MRLQRGTYQKPLRLEEHAQVPRAVAVGLALVNDNGVQETLASNSGDHRVANIFEALTEFLTHGLCAFDHVFLLNELESTDSNSRTQRVAAVRGTVCARFDCEHDLPGAQHCRHGVHATRDGLAEQNEVWLDAAPLMAEHLTGPCNTSLDLVANEENVVLVAEGADLSQVAVVRYDNASLTLDGLNKERSSVLAVLLEDLTNIVYIVITDGLASRGVDTADVR